MCVLLFQHYISHESYTVIRVDELSADNAQYLVCLVRTGDSQNFRRWRGPECVGFRTLYSTSGPYYKAAVGISSSIGFICLILAVLNCESNY